MEKARRAKERAPEQTASRLWKFFLLLTSVRFTVQDRCLMVCIVYDDQAKQAIAYVQDKWRKLDEERRAKHAVANGKEAGVAASSAAAPIQMQVHQLGSQRAIFHAQLFAEFLRLVQEAGTCDPNLVAAAKEVSTATADFVDRSVFRFKPKHDQPKDGRPWIWQLMFTETVDQSYRRHVQALVECKVAGLKVAFQHSVDDPIAKQLGKGNGKGSNVGSNVVAEDMDSALDSEARTTAAKRKKDGEEG